MSLKAENENTNAGWHPDQPYQNLPLLPPESVNLETKAILKRCISARAALAELKQAAELIPNQTMLISILFLRTGQPDF